MKLKAHEFDKSYFCNKSEDIARQLSSNENLASAKKEIDSFFDFLNALFEYDFRCKHYSETAELSKTEDLDEPDKISYYTSDSLAQRRAHKKLHQSVALDNKSNIVEKYKVNSHIVDEWSKFLENTNCGDWSEDEYQLLKSYMQGHYDNCKKILENPEQVLESIKQAVESREASASKIKYEKNYYHEKIFHALVYMLANNPNLHKPIPKLDSSKVEDRWKELEEVARAFGVEFVPMSFERVDGRSPREIVEEYDGKMTMKYLACNIDIRTPMATQQGGVVIVPATGKPNNQDAFAAGGRLVDAPKIGFFKRLYVWCQTGVYPKDEKDFYGARSHYRYFYRGDEKQNKGVRFGTMECEDEILSVEWVPSQWRLAYYGEEPNDRNKKIDKLYSRERVPCTVDNYKWFVLYPWQDLPKKRNVAVLLFEKAKERCSNFAKSAKFIARRKMSNITDIFYY